MSAMTVLVVAAPPDALLVAPFGRAVEPLIGSPKNVQAARVCRIGVIDGAVFQHEGAHAWPLAEEGSRVRTAGGGTAGDRLAAALPQRLLVPVIVFDARRAAVPQ